MKLRPIRATNARLAGFGTIAAMPKGKPTSRGAGYRFWSDLVNYEIHGMTEIGLCTVFRRANPEINGMERHLRTPEILIPVDAPFVVPLLIDGRPSREAKAFRVNLGEAIVINEGVWHGACLPVGRKQSSYFVIFRRGTPHEDVEKKPIEPFVLVVRK